MLTIRPKNMKVRDKNGVFKDFPALIRNDAVVVEENIGGLDELSNLVIEELKEKAKLDYFNDYSYPTYTQATINDDGTVNTSGIEQVTDLLKVIPNEVLILSTNVFNKVAFYDENKDFISLISVSSDTLEYKVPNSSYYARYQVQYNGAELRPLIVRKSNRVVNRTFKDLIYSPLKTVIDIGMTGDSNTYGYGLSSTDLSWGNLFKSTLESLNPFVYRCDSPYVETIGLNSYSDGYNAKKGSEISILTDATNIDLKVSANYDSTFEWYVDNIIQDGKTSITSLELDGELHKVTVKFTGGQAANPFFEINKTITVENKAVTGVYMQNVTIPENKDWLIIMIGTNGRPYNLNTDTSKIGNGFRKYSGKGTYIVPFPNHKEDSSYVISESQLYPYIRNGFEHLNYEIVDCSDIAGAVFYDDSLYQGDKIHFSEDGHRVMANIISGRMGIPTYFKKITS